MTDRNTNEAGNDCVVRTRCDLAPSCILQTETLDPECWPTGLAERVAKCATCAQMALALRQIEDDWRHLPVPAAATQAPMAFLQKITALEAPSRTRRWVPTAFGAVAAAARIALGVLAWIMPRRPRPISRSAPEN